jgi:hypothetical protein
MLEVLLFSVLAIVVGLGLSFAGYAAFRVILPILGFLAGFWLGMDVVSNFAADFPLMGISLGLFLGFIFGALFAAAAYFLYSLAIIIFGLALGYTLGAGLMLALGLDYGFITFLVGVSASIGMAMLFLKGNMPMLYIQVITAFAGASAIIGGVLVLFGQIPPSQLGLAVIQPYITNHFLLVVIWAVIGAVGFSVQYQMAKMSESMIPASYSYDVTTKEYEAKAKKPKA